MQESLADSDGGWAAFVGDNTEAASTSHTDEPWDPFQTGRAASAGDALNIEPSTAGTFLGTSFHSASACHLSTL